MTERYKPSDYIRIGDGTFESLVHWKTLLDALSKLPIAQQEECLRAIATGGVVKELRRLEAELAEETKKRKEVERELEEKLGWLQLWTVGSSVRTQLAEMTRQAKMMGECSNAWAEQCRIAEARLAEMTTRAEAAEQAEARCREMYGDAFHAALAKEDQLATVTAERNAMRPVVEAARFLDEHWGSASASERLSIAIRALDTATPVEPKPPDREHASQRGAVHVSREGGQMTKRSEEETLATGERSTSPEFILIGDSTLTLVHWKTLLDALSKLPAAQQDECRRHLATGGVIKEPRRLERELTEMATRAEELRGKAATCCQDRGNGGCRHYALNPAEGGPSIRAQLATVAAEHDGIMRDYQIEGDESVRGIVERITADAIGLRDRLAAMRGERDDLERRNAAGDRQLQKANDVIEAAREVAKSAHSTGNLAEAIEALRGVLCVFDAPTPVEGKPLVDEYGWSKHDARSWTDNYGMWSNAWRADIAAEIASWDHWDRYTGAPLAKPAVVMANEAIRRENDGQDCPSCGIWVYRNQKKCGNGDCQRLFSPKDWELPAQHLPGAPVGDEVHALCGAASEVRLTFFASSRAGATCQECIRRDDDAVSISRAPCRYCFGQKRTLKLEGFWGRSVEQDCSMCKGTGLAAPGPEHLANIDAAQERENAERPSSELCRWCERPISEHQGNGDNPRFCHSLGALTFEPALPAPGVPVRVPIVDEWTDQKLDTHLGYIDRHRLTRVEGIELLTAAKAKNARITELETQLAEAVSVRDQRWAMAKEAKAELATLRARETDVAERQREACAKDVIEKQQENNALFESVVRATRLVTAP